MSERPLDNLTLREKFIEVDKVTRELIDHLERGFIPKAHELRRLARRANEPDHQDEIKDVTIRSSTEGLLHTDGYTRQLRDRMGQLLSAIEQEVRTIFEHG